MVLGGFSFRSQLAGQLHSTCMGTGGDEVGWCGLHHPEALSITKYCVLTCCCLRLSALMLLLEIEYGACGCHAVGLAR